MRPASVLSLALLAIVACGGADDAPAREGDASQDTAPVGTVARDAETIVLVVVDDLRASHLGAYGYELPTTPALDALAAESVVFDDCLTVSTGLNASFASLLTGRFAQDHGVGSLRHRGQHRLADSRTTIAESLRDAGWKTIGAVSRPQLRADISGLDQGFERWLEPGLHEGSLRTADQTFYNARNDLRTLFASDELVFALLHFSDPGARGTLDGPDGARFLRAHLDPYRETRPVLAAALARVEEDPTGAVDDVAKLFARGRGSEEHTAFRAAGYDARLAVLDRHLGELFELLRESGRYERSLVVVTATRGGLLAPPPTTGAPGFLPDVVRTPLIVRFPGGAPVARVDSLVQSIDVAPTLHSSLGVWEVPEVSGESLVNLVEHGRPRPRLGFCEAANFERRAVFAQRVQVEENRVGGLVPWTREGTRMLETDLAEERAEELAALRAALTDFRVPALVRVESGGGAPLDVRWRFAEGFAGPARIESAAGEREPRVIGLAGTASLGAEPETLVFEASRRDLPLRLDLDFGDGEIDEDRIALCARALSTSLVPRLPGSSTPEWPSDEGTPLPCDAELEQQSGTWWRLQVGHESGESGRPVEALVALYPPGELHETLEWSASNVEVVPVPGRADVVIFRGETPLDVQIEKTPRRDFGLAVRLDGATLRGDAIRYRGRIFAEPGEVSLYLPDWVAGVTDSLSATTLPPEKGHVQIFRTGPSVPNDERVGLDVEQLEFVEKLGGGE